MNRADRPYDIVLFGATGFVGTLTAEYLAARAPAGLRWAIAGRGTERLERLRERLPGGAEIGLLRADVSDPASLRALAERARVVATTVGPMWSTARSSSPPARTPGRTMSTSRVNPSSWT
ncbi:hypothetical protein SHKM778_37820 [Streptomyces sp. KM77-8]|uniref:Saccharopine dehydrogenase NADP binding domain-containing protein n=1 Tax=Streptomyces haneummycinicus TaxID=3074435 RepID=A0AAT9HJ01_9ACTN